MNEKIKRLLLDATRGISNFPEFLTAFIFAGGSSISRPDFLEYLCDLFFLAVEIRKDDLALATLEKVRVGYHVVEEEIEEKKEWGQKHLGKAGKRADDKFFEFIASAYPKIPYKIADRIDGTRILMQKTRFRMLEYASQQWTQEMTSESYSAFHFLIRAFASQEKKEILEKIFRPRVENWFKNVEFIEKWIMVSREHPVPHEIQHLLAMARAKAGGPELAKKDIANSRTLGTKLPLGPEDINDLIA